MLPRISVFSLGGTIAMGATAPGKGVSLSHSAEMLIAAVPALADIAEIEAQSFRQLPSPDITLDDLAALAREINQRLADGVRGIVVTQGTDTLEESAFVIDRLVQNDAPVVFTGAMRNPTMPGPDGPANLFHAVLVALDQQARGIGTRSPLVVKVCALCLRPMRLPSPPVVPVPAKTLPLNDTIPLTLRTSATLPQFVQRLPPS